MQRVVRSSLLGLLTIAGLTACGDKVTVPGTTTTPPITPVVHNVTVNPGTASINFLGTFQFAASVDADAGISSKAVTWKTGDATIATVDATGKVTALSKAGTTSVIATSVADASVSGAAVLTVSAAGGGGVVTVSIASINATVCGLSCASVPANQQNFGTAGAPATTGQLDVVLNVDAGGQVLKSVSATLKCGNDSIVQTETISSSSVAPLSADEASAPVQLSFNTLALNASNVPLLHNAGGPGAATTAPCNLSASAVTASGTQSAATSQTIVLNNADVSIVTIATTSEALDPNNLPWVGGGPLTITAIPVMYSGRTAVSASIGLVGGITSAPACPGLAGLCNPGLPGAQTINALTAGAFTATWNQGPTAPSVQGLAVKGTAPTVAITDNSGTVFFGIAKATLTATNPAFTNALGGVFGFNFDDQKPQPGTFSVLNNPDQNIVPPLAQGYVGAPFRFVADSASGFRGPNASAGNQTANFDDGGVDKVTTIFQFRTNGSGAYTTVANTSTIGESVANNSYQLRWITMDALGNADTTGVADSPTPAALTFGVDKTPPVQVLAAGPAANSTSVAAAGNGVYAFATTDNLSGPGAALVAQVRNWGNVASVNSGNEGRINTNVAAPPGATYFLPGTSATAAQQPCYIGRFNAAQANAGPNALTVYSAAGAVLGYCTPVIFNLASAPPNTTISSDFTGVDGYWTTEVVAADVAGNQAAPFTRVVLQDQTAPVINNIDLPPTATGNATVPFPANVTDNANASVGDIVSSWIVQTFKTTALDAAGGTSFRWPATPGPGVAFDNVLSNAITVTPSIPNFAKNIQLVGPAGAAVAPVAAGNDSAVTITAAGAASTGPLVNTGSLSAIFAPGLPQLVAGSSANGTWGGANFPVLNAGWAVTSVDATLSDCPGAGCAGGAAAANHVSTLLTATATGATATFANPLVGGAVTFWYRVTGSATPWFPVNNGANVAAAGVSRDDGVHRFWDYTLTLTPDKTAPDGTVLTAGSSIDVIAMGVNPAGDAIVTSAVRTIVLTNP